MKAKQQQFTADWHLGHKPIIPFCDRPFRTVEGMDNALVDRFNRRVCDDTLTYFLGDMCFWPPRVGLPLLRQLRGEKILILGNHDKYSQRQYRDAGFTVLHEAVIELCGKRLRLSHYPYWPQKPEGEPKHELRYPHLRPERHKDEWLIHGHVHKNWKTRVEEKMINVGVDVWGYQPVAASQIESIISKAEQVPLVGAGL